MKTISFNKRILATVVIALFCCFSAKAQITPSVYVGWGNYTNLGGTIGIGTEVRYKFISANAAIGTAYYLGAFDGLEIVSGNPWLGFDFGLKGYVYKGLFAGVNYGVLGKYRLMETQDCVRVRDLYGFSFTVGYKWHYYKGIFGTAYAGWTSSKDANNFLGDFGGYIPRVGLTLGYDFKH
jgi:hypothetical protein